MYPRWITHTSRILTLVFMLNAGFGLLLASRIYFHRLIHRLESDNRVTTTLSIDAKLVESENELFEWEHETEFEYNEEMYDVISSRKEGGCWIFTCYKDSEEDELNVALERESDESTPGKTSSAKKQSKSLSEFVPVTATLVYAECSSPALHSEAVPDFSGREPVPPHSPPWNV